MTTTASRSNKNSNYHEGQTRDDILRSESKETIHDLTTWRKQKSETTTIHKQKVNRWGNRALGPTSWLSIRREDVSATYTLIHLHKTKSKCAETVYIIPHCFTRSQTHGQCLIKYRLIVRCDHQLTRHTPNAIHLHQVDNNCTGNRDNGHFHQPSSTPITHQETQTDCYYAYRWTQRQSQSSIDSVIFIISGSEKSQLLLRLFSIFLNFFFIKL